MTSKELQQREQDYREATKLAESRRVMRNQSVRIALRNGMTQREVARVIGRSHGWVAQIASKTTG